MKDGRRRAAVWGLVFATLFWGATFFLMKSGSEVMAERVGRWAQLLFLAIRFAIAAILFPAVFPWLRKGGRAAIGWGVAAGIPFAGGFILQIYGLADTDPSVSALFTSMFVVFTPIMMFVLFRRLPGRQLALGIAFAVAGLWLIAGTPGPAWGRGEILSLLCAVVFSAHIIVTDIGSKRVDPIAMAWHSVTFSALVCAAPLLFARPSVFPAIPSLLRSPTVLTGLAVTSVLATVGSCALMNHYQKFVTPNRAAVVYTLEPVFASIFSWAFAGERFGERKLLGGALVLAGNLVSGLKREAAPEPIEKT